MADAANARAQEQQRIATAIRLNKERDLMAVIAALPAEDASRAQLDQFSQSEFMTDPTYAALLKSKARAIERNDIVMQYIQPKDRLCQSAEYKAEIVALWENGTKVLDVFDQHSRAIQWVNLTDTYTPEVLDQITSDTQCTGTVLTNHGQVPVSFGPQTINGKMYFQLSPNG